MRSLIAPSSPIYCFPTFKFIVEGKEFHVHESLITQHSKPLERMIHGSMTEAQHGFATIEEVDYGTFLRFVEWLYRGYYHAAEPEEPAHNINVVERFDAWGKPVYYNDDIPSRTVYSSKKLVRGRNRRSRSTDKRILTPDSSSASFYSSTAKNTFIQRTYTMRNISRDHPQPRPNKAAAEDYTEVNLFHFCLILQERSMGHRSRHSLVLLFYLRGHY